MKIFVDFSLLFYDNSFCREGGIGFPPQAENGVPEMSRKEDTIYNEAFEALLRQREDFYLISSEILNLVYRSGRCADEKQYMDTAHVKHHPVFLSLSVKMADISAKLMQAKMFLMERKYSQLCRVWGEIELIARFLMNSMTRNKDLVSDAADDAIEHLEAFCSDVDGCDAKYRRAFKELEEE